MIQNYLKLAWRNLTKSKIFSFINIFGLAAGTLCVFFVPAGISRRHPMPR